MAFTVDSLTRRFDAQVIKQFPLKMFHLPHIYVDSQKITNDLCYEDEDLDTRANVVKSSNKYLQKTKLLL